MCYSRLFQVRYLTGTSNTEQWQLGKDVKILKTFISFVKQGFLFDHLSTYMYVSWTKIAVISPKKIVA
jgi:hypothetical protein